MKRLFLDTNFVIDYFVRQDFQGDAENLLAFGRKAGYKFYISYLTVANFAYIMRKMPPENLKSLIKRICTTFIVINNTEPQILSAVELNASDFEDALQYQAALAADCDIIITRNKKDFDFSSLPVMSASSFLLTMLK